MEKNTTALNDQNANQEGLGIIVDNNDSVQEMLDVSEIDTPDYSSFSLKEIVEKFRDMLERADQQELYKNADLLKAAFYKVLKKEKLASGLFSESQDGEEVQHEVSDNPFTEIERAFKEVYSQYKSSRQEFLHNVEKTKEENYAKKQEVIDELKSLLDKAEDVNHTFPAFRDLQNKWKSISNIVPQAKAKDLWESYQHLVEKFYDYIKINNEFRDLDFKKNLEAKTILCEKAETLADESNIVNAFKELQTLHEEWKEIGPVAKDDREPIWERFKAATAVINKKHQSFFETLKETQKANLTAKTELCEQAEEIVKQNIESSNEWNSLSKQMESLQTKWKTIGFASKKDNQKIYDRFRAACDEFYNTKREYYADFKNVMLSNLKKKEELCEQAEAIMLSDDWKKATDQLINLQKVWKEVGPVARKQSDAVWKRFRAACDNFFERKSKHFGEVDEKYEENLTAKLALVEKIKSYELNDSKDENISAMRSFSEAWNAIGFVPFKEKEKVQKLFNDAMDSHFADIRSIDSEKKLTKFKKMVSDAKNSNKGDKGLRFERDKLIQKFRKIEANIATLENNMGFFAKSKNADAFIEDIKKKIDIAKSELTQIEEKIKIIDKQFE